MARYVFMCISWKNLWVFLIQCGSSIFLFYFFSKLTNTDKAKTAGLYTDKHTRTSCSYEDKYGRRWIFTGTRWMGHSYSSLPCSLFSDVFTCVCWGAAGIRDGGVIGDTAERVSAPHCLSNVWKCMCIFKVRGGWLNLFPLPLHTLLPSLPHSQSW